MRRILTGVCVLLSASTGCMSYGTNHSRCGWHFEILKPPVIETSTPVLVNMGPGMQGANPLGTLAGPVSEGNGRLQPNVPPVQIAPQNLLFGPNARSMISDPCAPRGTMTVEEWCKVMQEMSARRMPVGSPVNGQQ